MRFIKRSPATLITGELTSFPCKSSVLQGPAIDYDFIKYWFYKDINTLECSFIKALIHPLVRTIFV